MIQEQPKEQKKILAQIFEELPPDAGKEKMLERANALLFEAHKHGGYENSIAVAYADEAFRILSHPGYDKRQDEPLTSEVENLDVFNNVANGILLRQYCAYLLARARENYVNEVMNDHLIIAERVMDFLEKE